MATAGQLLKGRHGVALYSAQSLQGTAVAPATAVGLVTPDVTSDTGMQVAAGLGSSAPLFFKPGLYKSDFSLSIPELQTKTFLVQAQRASGVVPWTTLGVGYNDDAGTKYGWQLQDCKINTFDVNCSAGGYLGASVSGSGGLVTELTTLVAANLTQTPMMWYEGVVLKGGSAYEITSFRFSVNHNIEFVPIIPGTAPSTNKRGWNYATEGLEIVTGEFTRFAKSAILHSADTIAAFTLNFAFTDIGGGGNSLTFAFTGAKFGSERMSMSPEGGIMFTTPFMALTWAVS